MCLLLLSCWINHIDIISPSVIFCISFLFAVCWATIYADKWMLDLHVNTFCVIIFGVLEFIVVTSLVHIVFIVARGSKTYWVRTELFSINIQKSKLIFFGIFEIVTLMLTVICLTRSIGGANLGTAIFLYRYGDVSDSVIIPSYINIMRTCVNAAAYWFSYVFANNLVVNKKVDKASFIIIILAMVNSVIVGGRGNVLYIFLTIIVIYIVMKNKISDNRRNKLQIKYVLIAIIILLVLILSYQSLGNLLGRGSTASLMDYLATYCGAEIKNLDTVLQQNIMGQSERFGEQTFINLYKWIGPRFGITDIEFSTSYQSINSYNLGNVYTMFYSFIYDFGYKGVFAMTFIMAFICQWIYELIRCMKIIKGIDIKIIAFGYIFNTILFSYFSNKFFEQIFSASFIYNLIFWGLFNLFFIRIRIYMKNKG